MNLGLICDVFKAYAQLKEMVVIGGGAQSELWRQLMADIYEMPVLKPNLLEEATSMGAAVTGGVGVGLFDDFDVVSRFLHIEQRTQPIIGNVDSYGRYRKVFEQTYFGLEATFSMLKDL